MPTANDDSVDEVRPPGTRYAYKASLIGSAHRFELTDTGLSWQVGGKSAFLRYADVAAIRLSYRPVTMQARRFRMDIATKDGQRIAIISVSWQTAALMAPQDRDYRDFVVQLHARLAQAGAKVALSGGLRPAVYAASNAFLAVVTVAMGGLLIRALATGNFGGALFIVGFAALFGWQIGGFVRRNRPRNYTFDALPKDLLP